MSSKDNSEWYLGVVRDAVRDAVHNTVVEKGSVSKNELCGATSPNASKSHALDILSELPVELSLKILSYLTVFELCQSVSYVCSRWYSLSRDLNLWHALDISTRDRQHIGVEQLLGIKHMLTRLRSLDVTERDDVVNIKGLIELCSSLSSLKRFNLGFCCNLNRPCLKVISLYCTDLEHLNLEGCKNVGPRSLAPLASLCLKSLSLSHCDWLEESDIVDLLEHQTTLEALDIDGIPCTSLSACRKVADLAKTLTRLRVDGISMEDGCLEYVSHCVNLTEFRISFCELLTDVGLDHLQSLDRLSSLCLKKGFLFSAGGLVGLFEAWKLGDPARMVYLNLTECSLVDDSTVTAIAAIFINLQELHLAWCWEVTDTGLLSIVRSLR
ncbi:F-box/LRR-repeat protein 7-like isoform X2 [Corticium candelabrum]|nr:F-box/LRR-repeat protein 7-like isoform X2 [Corticium candelabrum]